MTNVSPGVAISLIQKIVRKMAKVFGQSEIRLQPRH